ncbi:AraC family transcriptional regulator [Flavivirga sp. 57AJ16]|uniref:AraC family transcriptional regulator n=1 Tax=Flavivirga sp. 57AJ16 TaxID=3025307 RepID=UPI002365829A|nr:AraC family transcriptional regulator [Flavivirga sp. 57AJ16]MDD7885377.1 AraC family transcriptional regulator [Flavivirga sp. 57AJ16]
MKANNAMKEKTTLVEEGFLGQRMIVLPKKIINGVQKNPLINTLYFTDIGFFPRANHHSVKRLKGSKEFILIYCCEGEGVIRVDNKNKIIKSNSFYIIAPGEPHEYYAKDNNPWSIYWVHFTGNMAGHFYNKFISEYLDSPVQIALKERRINLFENLIGVMEDGYSTVNLEYVNLSLWQLLNTFLYKHFYVEDRKKFSENNTVESIIGHMKENLNMALKIDDIAAKFNYSSSHLFTLFKQKTGYSPIHYFNYLKIQKACQYLIFTTKSVKEISFALGYNDPLYFSRLFKKIMSSSPLQYRKKYGH